ncbi:MAG: polysaccharide biosynthesis/export family protein [Dysgonamonadaceae bacterium]|nr:polysaccharide biosynthesis/export family protein [Dysgonamonadaceae bacterium]
MKLNTLFIIVLATVLFSGCNSWKEISYVNGVEQLTGTQLSQNIPKESKILPNDVLTITVNTVNPSAAVPFNLPLMPVPGDGIGGIYNTVGAQTYIVDKNGNIDFPVLGKIHVGGLTRSELENRLKSGIYPKYITEEPIVTTRFVNYKISILGEVNRPNLYTFPTDRVNLFEALAMAGDLTIYGKRDNVLLKRENADGTNQFIRMNLQDKNLVLSPYFYLQQNDVIYVEPNKARGNSSSIGSTENITISVVSIMVSVATLLITVFK